MWHELSYGLAVAFVNWLPNHWHRQHLPTARLGYAFEAFARGWSKDAGPMPDFYEEWVPEWMVPDDAAGVSVFSAQVAEDVDLAFDLGFLSQAALVALGPKRLRAAGAFKKDRSTDTSIGG